MRQFSALKRYTQDPNAVIGEYAEMIESSTGEFYRVEDVQRRLDELYEEVLDTLTWGMPF